MGFLVEQTGDFQKSVARAILHEVHDQIEKVKEEIVSNASEEFRKRVKSIVADVAMNVSDYYSIERAGQDILIRVKFEQGQK
jgi:vacuolar-type H+-ATPase subunit H